MRKPDGRARGWVWSGIDEVMEWLSGLAVEHEPAVSVDIILMGFGAAAVSMAAAVAVSSGGVAPVGMIKRLERRMTRRNAGWAREVIDGDRGSRGLEPYPENASNIEVANAELMGFDATLRPFTEGAPAVEYLRNVAHGIEGRGKEGRPVQRAASWRRRWR